VREPTPLSRYPPEDAADPKLQLCVFKVGQQPYAVDLMRVEEVLNAPEVSPIPSAPSFTAGVVHLRGSIVPAIDLRELLSIKSPPAAAPKCLICRVGRRRVGVMVEEVGEVMRVRRSQLTPLPSLVAPGENPHLVGLAGLPDRPVLLLDLKSLLRMKAGIPGPR
jgi:purine-binding chemotaxis protein CheW